MVTRGMLHGRTVYAEQGESLRHEIIFCLHCNAKMYIKHLPECPTVFYFATMPGQEHTSPICIKELAKNARILGPKSSPEKLIEILSTPPKDNQNTGNDTNTTHTSSPQANAEADPTKVYTIRSLQQLINSGIYDVQPDALTCFDSAHCFIDYIILCKRTWTSHIWPSNELVPIGARVIDVRWVGSIGLKDWSYKIVIERMIRSKKLWFVLFWKVGDHYERVCFCLDCESCFASIKAKLFVSGTRLNDTYNEFVPVTDKLDVLVAATWHAMTSAECHQECPTPNMCKNCKGAYWGKCNSTNQIELFPDDNFYKNKKQN